jgi:hypothetical protein
MRTLPLLLALAACQWTPPVIPRDPAMSAIAGDVVLAVPIEQAGPVVIFISEASNPMPPTGTGRPIAATSVRPGDFSASEGGLVTAPWSASNIPDGDYYITAVMDNDDNFGALIDPMAAASCGDIVGAHLDDITNQGLAVVHVDGGGIGTLVDEVTIVLAQTIPFQPPAFTIDGNNSVDAAEGGQDPTSQVYTVKALPIQSSLLQFDGPAAVAEGGCGTIFPLYAPDDDGDGHFDPHPNPAVAEQGVFNVWPKIFVQYLGTPVDNDDGSVTYENDMEEGESWAGENVPSPKYTLLGTLSPGATVLKDDLDYVWLPGALHFTAEHPEGEIVQDVSLIPRGAWSLTMISFTGQTWTIPNVLPAYPVEGDWDPSSQTVVLDVE